MGAYVSRLPLEGRIVADVEEKVLSHNSSIVQKKSLQFPIQEWHISLITCIILLQFEVHSPLIANRKFLKLP